MRFYLDKRCDYRNVMVVTENKIANMLAIVLVL